MDRKSSLHQGGSTGCGDEGVKKDEKWRKKCSRKGACKVRHLQDKVSVKFVVRFPADCSSVSQRLQTAMASDDSQSSAVIVNRYQQGREKLHAQGEIDSWEDPEFELYHVTDRYGFIHKSHLPDRLTEYENKLRETEANRSRKWLRMLTNWEQFENTEKLRQRVNKGIPNQVRGQAWCKLMGVEIVKSQQDGRYGEMLTLGLQHSSDIRQIDLDVNRTFRNNIMFKDRYCLKQQELFNILVAYSVYNSEIGYCQGMSQIAALLLMYISDEEDVFWALDRLMTADKYAMHGFFIPGFPKLIRFARHHDKILKKNLPRVFKHFKKFDIDSTLYTLKWFFQCFLDRVPFSLTLRLWDCFMMEGEVVLTSMSYTLLKLHKKTVIKKSMEELIEFLQIDLEKDFGYRDDEAINALVQSMAELRKQKMELPREAPLETEKPTKPFGTISYINDSKLSTSHLDHRASVSLSEATSDKSDVDRTCPSDDAQTIERCSPSPSLNARHTSTPKLSNNQYINTATGASNFNANSCDVSVNRSSLSFQSRQSNIPSITRSSSCSANGHANELQAEDDVEKCNGEEGREGKEAGGGGGGGGGEVRQDEEVAGGERGEHNDSSTARVTISVPHEIDAEKVRIFVPYQNVSPSDSRRDKVIERSAVPLVDT